MVQPLTHRLDILRINATRDRLNAFTLTGQQPRQRPQGKRESHSEPVSSRLEDALKRLARTIETGRLKDRHKMERRLGRIQAKHSQVTGLSEVDLRDTPEGVRLFWQMKEDRKVGRRLHAAYQSSGRHSRGTLVTHRAYPRKATITWAVMRGSF